MRPVGHLRPPDRTAGRAGLLQLLPLRRCAEQCGGPAARGDAPRGLADHGGGRRPQAAGRRRAGGGPGGFSAGGDRRRWSASATSPSRGEEIAALPPAEWESVIIATGPLTSAALAAASPALTGEDASRLLRCHRPHRPSRVASTSASPGSSRAMTRKVPGGGVADYINLPLDQAQYKDFVAALLDGEKTDFKEWEKSTPYFEACLPVEVMAARGRGHTALRADEAGGADRSAHRLSALCGGAAAPGQCPGHAVEHGGLPDQTETWRTDAHLPHHSRAGESGVRPAGRAAPQHLHQLAAACWTGSCD